MCVLLSSRFDGSLILHVLILPVEKKEFVISLFFKQVLSGTNQQVYINMSTLNVTIKPSVTYTPLAKQELIREKMLQNRKAGCPTLHDNIDDSKLENILHNWLRNLFIAKQFCEKDIFGKILRMMGFSIFRVEILVGQ